VPVPTLLACYLLTRSEALVTNRRLLVGRGLYRPQITELPLSMITRVPGLAVGSPHLIAVESAGGRAFVLNELPEARQLGRAVAEAAGLPLPAGPASVGERAARVLKAGGFWGTLPGFFAVLLIPLFVLDLGEPATLGAFLVLFLPYLIFVGTAGVVVGWILGSLLVLACLRLLVTADEIEEALRTLQQMADAVARYQGSHIDYLGYWSRPLVARLAAWVYGRPMHLNADGAERHVR